MTNSKPIDFEVVKEPWNKYQIQDNSILKTRTILKKVERLTDGDKISFNIDAQTITVIYADSPLKGIANPEPVSKQELEKTIDKPDMRYDTLEQDFNEYDLDDGTKMKIFTHVSSITRTTSRDKSGDPIYMVQSSSSLEIKLGEQYKQSKK